MVLKCEPIFRAVEAVREMAQPAGKVVYLTPSGRKLDQACVKELSGEARLILLCGHYEGVDQRVCDHLVDEEISIGDYVLSNGAVAALVLIDAVARLLPGVLGNGESAENDSFSAGMLEGPQYTRPEEFRGWRIPEILLSKFRFGGKSREEDRFIEKRRKVMKLIEKIEAEQYKTRVEFNVGDSVKVHTKVKEGEKERIQIYAGIVIGRKGRGMSETFTVRRISFGGRCAPPPLCVSKDRCRRLRPPRRFTCAVARQRRRWRSRTRIWSDISFLRSRKMNGRNEGGFVFAAGLLA
jgi:tRNA (guanine-N1)-methyltransferase